VQTLSADPPKNATPEAQPKTEFNSIRHRRLKNITIAAKNIGGLYGSVTNCINRRRLLTGLKITHHHRLNIEVPLNVVEVDTIDCHFMSGTAARLL